ncbi:protein phosphatase [Bifidobacterium goeldii]|uniref:Protein phosphatase n=1 Tax=Bifidobacterium goeldii TaxID=2306975 RepID=A0A430FKV5_9BIFI|nr:serine/threonine-protein phosphatase [Bifidobacterium goeldii]RSX53420.1 protein phosphatase [Bifidobacterium goeldii]
MSTRHIEAAIGSNTGYRRAENQDRGYADHGMYLVCDGMGGGVGGQRASAAAIERFHSVSTSPKRSRAFIDDVLQAAQHDVSAIGRELGGVAGTTITGLIAPRDIGADGDDGSYWEDPYWYVVNIGDSRTYHLSQSSDGSWDASSITHVTRDHSKRQEVIDSGMMLPDMANAIIPRNIITQCLGAPEGIRPDYYAVESRGRFIICSDGLHGEVSDDVIASVAAANPNPQEAVDALINVALDAGGSDNVTVIVVDIHDDDQPAHYRWETSKLGDGEELDSISENTLDAMRAQQPAA